MPCPFHPADSDALRQHLMAPEPMKRIAALHALEVEMVEPAAPRALAGAAARLAARGIPFYAVNDPQYRAWVGKVVDVWQRLRAAHPAPAALT